METATSRSVDGSAFREKYGPWVVIAGASEGMGVDYGRMLAEMGLNCVLVSRRQELLDELGSALETEHGVQTRAIALDLSQRDAAQRLFDATSDLEVGLYISNAGADPHGSFFLDLPIEDWLAMSQRNTATVMECCYRFATPMRERGRGGLLIMSSGAGMGGTGRTAVYTATKAFEINLAESLWIELQPHGIDVTCLVTPGTDTPAIRRLMARTGSTLEGLYASRDVAAAGLRELGQRPTYVFPFMHVTEEMAQAEAQARQQRIEIVTKAAGQMFYGE